MSEAVERIKRLSKWKGITREELSKLTNIKYTRLVNIFNGRARLGHEEIELIGKAFPEFRYWIAFGETLPEAGQISPELEKIKERYKEVGGD